MKKFIKNICVLLMVLMLVGMTPGVFAAGNVHFDGDAMDFIFSPGSDYSPTDLFTDFKGVMPGDSITQQILIDNSMADETSVKLYMRSLGAQEGTDEFLSQMTLTVTQDGDSILYDAPANETAQLTDWVYLGKVYEGGEILLDVTLNVPIEMGNEFQDKIGYIDWQFMVEEIPEKAPETGDDMKIFWLMGITALMATAVVILLVMRKKNREA